MSGGVLAWGTGYLGGHMSFARGAGTGERGLHAGDRTAGGVGGLVGSGGPPAGGAATDLLDVTSAAEVLGVDADRVQAMVAGDLLVPVRGTGPDAEFTRAEVLAARLVGG